MHDYRALRGTICFVTVNFQLDMYFSMVNFDMFLCVVYMHLMTMNVDPNAMINKKDQQYGERVEKQSADCLLIDSYSYMFVTVICINSRR